MKKRNLRAAALLLAAAMTVGGGSTAFAAEETATGPGLEIERKEQQNQGAPSGAEEGGQNADGQGAETPADQGQTGRHLPIRAKRRSSRSRPPQPPMSAYPTLREWAQR